MFSIFYDDRPTSNFLGVAKIFDKLVHDQVYQYLISNDLLLKYQSGFLPNHCTLTALVGATNSFSVNIDKSLLNGVVFIDLKKRSILLTKHNAS